MLERQKNLHEIVPDGVLWNRPAMPLCLLDDAREVSATAVLHENVENSGVAVDVAVMVADDVFVMQVLEDVTGRGMVWVVVRWVVRRHSHFCDDLFAVALGHALEVEFLTCEDLPATERMRSSWPLTDRGGAWL